jgi:hypothetical protein
MWDMVLADHSQLVVEQQAEIVVPLAVQHMVDSGVHAGHQLELCWQVSAAELLELGKQLVL